MMILLLVLFLFVCSFVLFVTSRHDFVLLRQNISIRHVFDKALVILLFSLFIARVIYLVDERMYDFFLDPLRFLHVIIFFGFNIFGLITTLSLGVLFSFRKRKNFLRILDIYLLSFSPLIIFEAIYYLLFSNINIWITSSYLSLSLIVFILFVKMHSCFKIKDGVVAFSILIFSAISYLGYSFLKKELLIYSPAQILAILVIAISIYCLVLVQTDFFKAK